MSALPERPVPPVVMPTVAEAREIAIGIAKDELVHLKTKMTPERAEQLTNLSANYAEMGVRKAAGEDVALLEATLASTSLDYAAIGAMVLVRTAERVGGTVGAILLVVARGLLKIYFPLI